MPTSILGQRVLLLRRDKGLTQKELGTQIGISGNTIARLERGRIQDLGGAVVAKIAEVLKTSSDYLLGLSDNTEPKAA